MINIRLFGNLLYIYIYIWSHTFSDYRHNQILKQIIIKDLIRNRDYQLWNKIVEKRPQSCPVWCIATKAEVTSDIYYLNAPLLIDAYLTLSELD